ncbi:MAG: hypothetical protein ABI617_04265 [Sphingomicrobium sp.]
MTDHTNQTDEGQSGIDQETERRNRENETGEQNQTPPEPTQGEPESGFVGSTGDQSGDYLTKGENQDFQLEGQGATDTDAGTSDIETGQPTSADSALDDGSDTTR